MLSPFPFGALKLMHDDCNYSHFNCILHVVIPNFIHILDFTYGSDPKGIVEPVVMDVVQDPFLAQ